jgi:hypothetical protein
MYETLLMLACIVVLVVLSIRGKSTGTMLLAALITAVWVTASGLYTYKTSNMMLGNLNLLPFLLWTTGLVIFKQLVDKNKFSTSTLIVVWVAGLMVIEYIGYNLLGIQLASNYAGFLGLALMHMPWWGILYYLAAGPVFIVLYRQLDMFHNLG